MSFAGGASLETGRSTSGGAFNRVNTTTSEWASVDATNRSSTVALSSEWELSCIDPPGSRWRVWNGDPIDTPAFQLQARSDRGEFDLFTETVEHEI